MNNMLPIIRLAFNFDIFYYTLLDSTFVLDLQHVRLSDQGTIQNEPKSLSHFPSLIGDTQV
ncbi:hypothetical protein SAMN02745181_0442 [Rubritalea squalenifaciens DSM 18772]|uniref:Uncharacterized protein n=1 Tax=Rubritalea squalenifaciens DSM 18772 TaxID=1123071 RepID=A0A1M6CC11_9BACT|nr:hypothetical protein SAMN02745181_0442 [Rubritalea squalenifaciens DSM 18772]